MNRVLDNKPAIFQISEPDMELFESFGKYLKETIEASPEWQAYVKRSGGQTSSAQSGDGFDDMESDIPF